MTLTELKYILAVARERHFGRAAEKCFVSQPTLSIAIKKLEGELGVSIFERGSELMITPVGEQIIHQAKMILSQVDELKSVAKYGQNPLDGTLKVGIIYTVAPYLLPKLIPTQVERTPNMPLVLQENYTHILLELLRSGELDCAIVALPIDEQGIDVLPLYDESFMLAVPCKHPLAAESEVSLTRVKDETMLLLGQGHCFRDQVLDVCPEQKPSFIEVNGMQKTLEGSSIETIRHMVMAGLGISLIPNTAVLEYPNLYDDLIRYIPIKARKKGDQPHRTIVIATRQSYPRMAAVRALRDAIVNCGLKGVQFL